MAHRQQMEFVHSTLNLFFPGIVRGKDVLEVGSRNINGSPRQFFTECRYVGIDAAKGPGVDVVCLAHDFRLFRRPEDPHEFHVVLCCEVLEHDPHFRDTLQMMAGRLLPGGLLIITAAGPARPEHGTVRQKGAGDYGPDPEFYHNVTIWRLAEVLMPAAKWSKAHIEYSPDKRDVYFYGVKDR